jgi:hypothetical protein
MTSRIHPTITMLRGGVLAAAIAACAACGGTDDGSPTATAANAPAATSAGGAAQPTTTVDPRDAALEFAQCMRENGVDMPDPDPNGQILIGGDTNTDPAVQAAAEEACRSMLDGMTSAGGGPSDFPARDTLLAFAKCMRGEGIDFPDPDFSGGNGQVVIGAPGGPSFDPTDPAFQAASQKCEQEAGMQVPGGASHGG